MARPKGSKNKATQVQADLIHAFNRCFRSGDWDALVRQAREQAMSGSADLFKAILPYVARKMPDTFESGEGSLVINLVNYGKEC